MTKAESARINGAKSRGPKTPETRAISSLNAMSHGITAKTLVVQNEDPDHFLQMFNSYIDYLKPNNPVDIDLVTDLVAARWRLRRIWTYETAMLDIEMDAQPGEEVSGAMAFQTLAEKSGMATALRYHIHLNRVYRQTLAEYRENANRTQLSA